jgi:uncharacterized protein
MMISRRDVLKGAGACGALGFTGFYTWQFEPHWLEIVERPLGITNLPKDLAGNRLVLISDLHIGRKVDDGYILKTFERIRSLSPDFVVFTGDLTDLRPDELGHAQRMIPHLPLGRVGSVGILGNHDYGPGWCHPEMAKRITDLAKQAGVAILRNEAVELKGLHFVGLDDVWAGRFRPKEALSKLPPGVATVALSHNPDTVDRAGWERFGGWILAGHTHGGQCKPPFLPPPVLPVENRRYTAGEFDLSGGRRLYISRGVGHTLRVRFNVRPEVTVFYLSAV